MSHTILLVEDNPHIMEINHEALMMEGYEVLEAFCGQECLDILKTAEVDMVVLDIMLPDMDGLALCRQITTQYDLPILILSALGENEQIIEGLRAGGDDYLSKPYDIGVLLARIEARLRSARRGKRFVSQGSLRVDTRAMIAYHSDTDLLLNPKELLLLLTILRSDGRRVGKEELYSIVWGTGASGDLRAMHTTISRLNKKLGSAHSLLRVVFRRGEGYGLEEV